MNAIGLTLCSAGVVLFAIVAAIMYAGFGFSIYKFVTTATEGNVAIIWALLSYEVYLRVPVLKIGNP